MNIGSLVQCIRQFKLDEVDLNVPQVGDLYTIRNILTLPDGLGLLLEEISNPRRYYDDVDGFSEKAFDIKGFKEVQEPMNVQELIKDYQQELIILK